MLTIVVYRIPFSLKGIPVTDYFVQRDEKMKHLEAFFQHSPQPARRKIFVVLGSGGMGKTQLCVEFARKHRDIFSAILWLDGSSKDVVRQSLADAALRLPLTTSSHVPSAMVDMQEELIDRLTRWLSLPDNTSWLLIFDNIDRDCRINPRDPQAYDFMDLLPSADHGNILVTTRLATLQKHDAVLYLDNVNYHVGKEILETRASKELPGM